MSVDPKAEARAEARAEALSILDAVCAEWDSDWSDEPWNAVMEARQRLAGESHDRAMIRASQLKLTDEELVLLRRKEWELRVYCPPDGNPGPFHAVIAKILAAYG